MARVTATRATVLDRTKTITFTFDGRTIEAHPGDTIGSALAAAGVKTISRSFKYHRPRGLYCMTGACPNCLVDVDGVPSVRSCTAPARAGARVASQNAFPSRVFDVLRLNDWFSFLLPVGFYYKTFIRPAFAWAFAEKLIRRVAGLGRLDPATFGHGKGAHGHGADVVHRHPDVVVAGGGASGMEAALAAAGQGKSVVLIEREPELGGHLRWESAASAERGRALAGRVAAETRIETLTGTDAFGLYEGNLITAAQGMRLWKIRAGEVVIATGREARHAVFEGNDLPGVMTGVAVRRLLNLYGVPPGRRAVVLAGEQEPAELIDTLKAAGIEVAAVARQPERTVVKAVGMNRVRAAVIAELGPDGTPRGTKRVPCDLLVVETGWDPVAQLAGQAGCEFATPAGGSGLWPVAASLPAGVRLAGSVTGENAGTSDARFAPGDGKKRFVCLCEDVTVKDVDDAITEGFGDIEMLKRFTTVAMGPCQGKTCSAAASALCASRAALRPSSGQLALNPVRAGLTTLRPPASPVPLAVLGADRYHPVRRTPLHHLHDALGAEWMDLGEWKRPYAYGDPAAEVRAVRSTCGIIDLSTLGRIIVEGADAGKLLDFVYTHRFSDLKPGRTRYAVICDDTGTILDDGTVTRTGPESYFITTSSGNVQFVEQWLKWWADTRFGCVHVTNVTAGWAAVNVAGPRAREALQPLTRIDLGTPAFPYMASLAGEVAGVPCRLMRIGFVGETGWEIHWSADAGEELWEKLLAAGKPFGMRPFGIEAQRVLRLEKKHVIVGVDTDALSNPLEADMAWAVKFDKPDFVGRSGLMEIRARGARQKLVGFVGESGVVPPDGSAILADGRPVGRVTSGRMSPTLGKPIGLGWVPVEHATNGTFLTIPTDHGTAAVRIVPDVFYDPAGERMKS